MIRALSARGILVGTVESAARPALLAAAGAESEPGALYGPRGIGHVGGAAAEQKLYPSLRSAEAAERIWTVSEQLTRTVLAPA